MRAPRRRSTSGICASTSPTAPSGTARSRSTSRRSSSASSPRSPATPASSSPTANSSKRSGDRSTGPRPTTCACTSRTSAPSWRPTRPARGTWSRSREWAIGWWRRNARVWTWPLKVRRLLLLVSAIVFADTMFYAAITPLLPHYADTLHLTKTRAGVLEGAYAAGTLVASLPAGWLAVRVGCRAPVVAGMGLLAATSVACGLAHDVVVLDVARFVQGVGGAASWAGGLAWLVGAAPVERRGAMIGTAL